ncbi:MAG: D-aminoacylase [Vicinamibacteria bacterium]|nr:D-aminoacylase [Vicinamibacteria bacterium]
MKRIETLAALALVLVFVSSDSSTGSEAPFDLVITGARIVDGSGNPWYRGDVYLRGDTVAVIDMAHRRFAAKRKIDGVGLVLAPGFIDIHTHARRAILDIPTAENYVRQGVTTLIEGPDGSSPVPLRPFLEEVARVKTSVNFGAFIGQGSIRTAIIGPNDREATAEERARMLEMVRQGMRDGAFGLSTGLFYVPGTFTPTEEVTALARVAGEMGGIHISHMRNEAADVLKSVNETIAIGEDGHLPTQVTHHKIIGKGNWGASTETLALVAAARARGVDATIDQYPYTASSTGINALLPAWAQDGGRDATLKRLQDPETRARIKAIVIDNIRFDRGGGDPKNIQIASAGFDPTLAGKNLAQITAARGAPVTIENAADTALDIIEKGGASAIFHAISEEDLVRIMRDPNSMVGSDGEVIRFGVAAPHPRGYGTFVRVLGRYVRDLKVITLQDAVRKMTSFPAQRLGLFDRGLVRPGMKADLVLFDEKEIGDRATFENTHQYAVGVKFVLVGGEVVFDGQTMTAARPGKILKGPSSDW